MKTLYTAHAVSTGGRGGHTETDDGKIKFDLSSPGGSGPGTNPEQLFACGYGACFGGAVEAAAKNKGVKTEEVKIKSEVNLNSDDAKGFFISVKLDAQVKGVDDATAAELVRIAHEDICPYSKATRGNVDVQLSVNGKPLNVKKAA